jgi:hypothetical protein
MAYIKCRNMLSLLDDDDDNNNNNMVLTVAAPTFEEV